MADPIYAKGTTGDVNKDVLHVKRRSGGFEAHVINTGEAAGLTATIEAATGPEDGPEVPDFSTVVAVYGPANVAGDAVGVLDVTAAVAEASGLTNYRVQVRSQATGAPTNFVVVTQDAKE